MNSLIVHAHPEPRSFNGALTRTALQKLKRIGAKVEVSDLYGDSFDPVERGEHYIRPINADRFEPLAEQRHAGDSGTLPEDVVREISRLQRADLVIFQFPLWWHSQPAILKGWFDRVFVNGLLYTSGMRYDRGYFSGKRAVISVTTGAPDVTFAPGGRGGDIACLLWPIQYSLHYMGFSVLRPQLSHGVSGHGYRYEGDDDKTARLGALLSAWERRLTSINAEQPIEFNGWNDWDEDGRQLPRRSTAQDVRLPHRTPTPQT